MTLVRLCWLWLRTWVLWKTYGARTAHPTPTELDSQAPTEALRVDDRPPIG